MRSVLNIKINEYSYLRFGGFILFVYFNTMVILKLITVNLTQRGNVF